MRPIEARSVHAPVDVAPYAILPEVAGLMQALGDGTLLYRSSDGYVITPGFTRFPANVGPARFVLPSDVPMPLGSTKNVQVLAQDTGECLIGSRC